MYWNNPRIECTWPADQDPVAQSLHGGAHCLFWQPAVPVDGIRYQQSLQHIADWANDHIMSYGVKGFIDNPANHYDIANIVKLNMWIADIREQGIVKPMMLFYDGHKKFGINNGESRLRALERVPEVTSVSGFISTRQEHAHLFQDLESVTTFDRFAELCGAVPGQQFLFTLTDPAAPYGIYWYEYNSARTAAVTPGEDWCVDALHGFLTQHPATRFTPEWWDTLVPWANYKSNN